MVKIHFKRSVTAIALVSALGFGLSIRTDIPKWTEGFAFMVSMIAVMEPPMIGVMEPV